MTEHIPSLSGVHQEVWGSAVCLVLQSTTGSVTRPCGVLWCALCVRPGATLAVFVSDVALSVPWGEPNFTIHRTSWPIVAVGSRNYTRTSI